MTVEEYYTTPSQEVFEEIKENAIKIWNTYDNKFGYASEKIDRIKDIVNIQDNAWYIVAMFDHINQQKLMSMVSQDTSDMIERALQAD